MTTTKRHDQKSLSAYLKSRGIIWDDIEQEHASKPAGRQRDSYDNAMVQSVQCQGFIESKSIGNRAQTGASDRCQAKTRHPSARCPKHRNQER